MTDDSVELRKERFFYRKTCAYCGSGDMLELDSVKPFAWVDESVWSLPPFEFTKLFITDVQILCNPCLLRKKRLWKSYRKEGGGWLTPYLEE